MYLEIQLLAGLPELEIASFANTFRCFDVRGSPGFARLPGARNRDFHEKKFRRFGAPGNPHFGDFREQVPAF